MSSKNTGVTRKATVVTSSELHDGILSVDSSLGQWSSVILHC